MKHFAILIIISSTFSIIFAEEAINLPKIPNAKQLNKEIAPPEKSCEQCGIVKDQKDQNSFKSICISQSLLRSLLGLMLVNVEKISKASEPKLNDDLEKIAGTMCKDAAFISGQLHIINSSVSELREHQEKNEKVLSLGARADIASQEVIMNCESMWDRRGNPPETYKEMQLENIKEMIKKQKKNKDIIMRMIKTLE